jgi:hypothetical protein
MIFYKNDIDLDLVEISVQKEAKAIFRSEVSRHGRSFSSIYDSTFMGHIAEQFLKQKHSFVDDTRMFMDVLSPITKTSIDVKCTKNIKKNLDYIIIKMLGKKYFQKYKNIADKIMFFENIDERFEYIDLIDLNEIKTNSFIVLDQAKANKIKTTPLRTLL